MTRYGPWLSPPLPAMGAKWSYVKPHDRGGPAPAPAAATSSRSAEQPAPVASRSSTRAHAVAIVHSLHVNII